MENDTESLTANEELSVVLRVAKEAAQTFLPRIDMPTAMSDEAFALLEQRFRRKQEMRQKMEEMEEIMHVLDWTIDTIAIPCAHEKNADTAWGNYTKAFHKCVVRALAEAGHIRVCNMVKTVYTFATLGDDRDEKAEGVSTEQTGTKVVLERHGMRIRFCVPKDDTELHEAKLRAKHNARVLFEALFRLQPKDSCDKVLIKCDTVHFPVYNWGSYEWTFEFWAYGKEPEEPEL